MPYSKPKNIKSQSYGNRVSRPKDKFVKSTKITETAYTADGHVGTDTEFLIEETIHQFTKAGTLSGLRINYDIEQGQHSGSPGSGHYNDIAIAFFLQKAGLTTPTPRTQSDMLPSGDNLSGNILHSKVVSISQTENNVSIIPQQEVVLKTKRKVKAGDTLKVLIGIRSPGGYPASYETVFRGMSESTFWVYY